MVIVDAVRGLGAIIGIVGAVITAPGAVVALWREDIAPALRRTAEVLHLAPKRPHNLSLAGGAIGASVVLAGLLATGHVWSEVLEEQIELLRRRTEQLDEQLQTLRSDMRRAHEELVQRIESAAQETSGKIRALHDRLDAWDQRSTRIDSTGLPVIALAFVLSGLPEAWVTPLAVAIPLGVASTGLTLLAIRRAWRLRKDVARSAPPVL